LLATVAAAQRVPVVDVSGPLNPPAGFDRYLDHVHPTIGGHQQIAERLIEGLAVDGVLPPLGTLSAAERVVSRTRYFTRLGPRYLVNGQRRLEWLENWARREKLADEIEPVTAAEHFRLAVRKLDFGDFDGATRSFRKAVETSSGVMREQIAGHADAIEAQGRPREAFQLREWLAAL
jgi:hypothetical protein